MNIIRGIYTVSLEAIRQKQSQRKLPIDPPFDISIRTLRAQT